MKKTIMIIIVLILLCSYVYIYNLATIPGNIVMFEGEKLNIKVATGLTIKQTANYKTQLTSTNLGESINQVGSNQLNVNLFGKISLKTINLDVIPTTKVVPLGQAIGMKLYTKGVLVVGMGEIESDANTKQKPYENSGISEGDTIIAINNTEVSDTNELIEEVNQSNGEAVKVKYIKNNEVLETSIVPAKSKNEYKLGLWVRDAAAGIGTLTFYEPSTDLFMSLGHGISDIDTEEIVEISSGELVTANVVSVIKGRKDAPGEIKGTITNGTTIGKIYKNTDFGVYGLIQNKQKVKNSSYGEIEVATREKIQEGKASILCQVDNEGVKEYEIEIEKAYKTNNRDNKSMLIKITDTNLIEKTGGIIQGMSGAPVIQNGKLIGAVTNVLVKDPTQGYAVFGDILIKQMRET